MALGFTLDPFDTVKEKVEAWDASKCTTEKQCEQSLAKALGKALVNQKIEKQYGSGRQRVDILVGDKVPIEMKYNLIKASVLQRLIGQLELYLKKWDHVILVLCGKISSNMLKDLRQYCSNKDMVPIYEAVHIVIKGKMMNDV